MFLWTNMTIWQQQKTNLMEHAIKNNINKSGILYAYAFK